MQIEGWLSNFDEREQSEIEFSQFYFDKFNHGTTGHNDKVIIAKMAKLLDAIQGDFGNLYYEIQQPASQSKSIYYCHKIASLLAHGTKDDN